MDSFTNGYMRESYLTLNLFVLYKYVVIVAAAAAARKNLYSSIEFVYGKTAEVNRWKNYYSVTECT
jgi:hypothetical protein